MVTQQLQKIFSLLHRRNRACRLALISLRQGRLSPMEAGRKLFEEVVPDERVFCFLLMVGRHDGLALRVITDLRKKKGQRGKISVDEALSIMEDNEMEEYCHSLYVETLQKLERKRIRTTRSRSARPRIKEVV